MQIRLKSYLPRYNHSESDDNSSGKAATKHKIQYNQNATSPSSKPSPQQQIQQPLVSPSSDLMPGPDQTWTGPPPKSPSKTIIRAHLGDHGHTFVPTKPGTTVRDALYKAMKLRKLVPETCAVYKCSDPSKVNIRKKLKRIEK